MSTDHLHLARALRQEMHYQTLDAEFRALFAPFSAFQRSLLRYRYDPSRLSFEQCAARLGRSRDRVRVIAIETRETLLARFGTHQFPRIRTAIHIAAAQIATGGSLRDLGHDLAERGLMQHDRRLDDLLLIWNATDLERPFPHEHIAAARAGLTETQRVLRATIGPRAESLSRNCGALTPAWLTADAEPTDLHAALGSLGYEEIAPDWFWSDDTPHTVVESDTRKVFAVTERITPRALRGVLAKHHGRKQFPTPPTEIVRAVILRLRLATADGDHLKRPRQFDGQDALSAAEQALADFFRENGPVVSLTELLHGKPDGGTIDAFPRPNP